MEEASETRPCALTFRPEFPQRPGMNRSFFRTACRADELRQIVVLQVNVCVSASRAQSLGLELSTEALDWNSLPPDMTGCMGPVPLKRAIQRSWNTHRQSDPGGRFS